MSLNNIFTAIPENLDDELFQVLQQNQNIKIERIVSKGHTSPASGWYDEERNEWLMIVKGEAIITFENKQVSLKSGNYLNIPAHTKHKVSWTDPTSETIWLAVHY